MKPPLISILLLALSGPAAGQGPQHRHITAAVSYDRHCVYWAGDVGLSAEQFKSHLMGTADSDAIITIYHASDTPGACVRRARKLASKAGFRTVRDAIEDVITSLPPSPGAAWGRA
jgi:hypothetical protein